MNTSIIERIKKLQALAANKGATESEAMAAMAFARKIMEENQISEKDISQSDVIEHLLTPNNYDMKLLYCMIEGFREIRFLKNSRVIKLIGFKSDIDIFLIAYNMAVEHCNKCWKHFAKENPDKKPEKMTFFIGYGKKINQTLVSKKATTTPCDTATHGNSGTASALIVKRTNTVSEYIKDRYPRVKPQTCIARANGSATTLNAGLTAGDGYGVRAVSQNRMIGKI